MQVKVVSKGEASKWVCSLHMKQPSVTLAILLGGDRWSCVDEAVLAYKGEEIVGIATMALQGESNDGKPTIVAMYVLHAHRKSGVGYALLEAAINHMLLKGCESIHLDVLNSKVKSLINRLPSEKQEKLSVLFSTSGTLDDLLEY